MTLHFYVGNQIYYSKSSNLLLIAMLLTTSVINQDTVSNRVVKINCFDI